MISANGGLPAHRYTPQVTPRWPRGSEPASGDGVPDEVYGVDGAFGDMVDVPAEDRQGAGHVWLVSMAWRGEGRRSWRWSHRCVFMLVSMPVWWSIQRGHVLRALFAAWRRIVATSRTSGEWLWVMR